jgi:hypothetical protein
MIRTYIALMLLLEAAYSNPVPTWKASAAMARTAISSLDVALKAHDEIGCIGGWVGGPQLLANQWEALRSSAQTWLNETRQPSEAAFATALRKVNKDLTGQLLPLDSSSYLVAIGRGSFGTAFILRREGREFRTKWSITEPLPNGAPGADVLAVWSLRRWKTSGPYAACAQLGHPRTSVLSADAQGRPRFYLAATYAQDMGGTMAGQISFWRWNGRSAEPLLARGFAFAIDQDATERLDGDTVRVRVKDEHKRMFACGQCNGRQRDWIFRVGAQRIADLGKTSLVPELDLVDDVVDRLLTRRAANDLAAPQAVALLKAQLREARQADMLSSPETLGMYDYWVRPVGAMRQLCLATDFGFVDLFTISRKSGKLRIVAAKSLSHDCGPNARS